jgi:hypothetical protein
MAGRPVTAVRILVAGVLVVGALNVAAAAAAVSPWLGAGALAATFVVIGVDKVSASMTC